MPAVAQLANFIIVESMGFADIFNDSVEHLSEALQLWRRRRLEYNAGNISKWLGHLLSLMKLVSDSLSAHIYAALQVLEITGAFPTIALASGEDMYEFAKQFLATKHRLRDIRLISCFAQRVYGRRAV